MKKVARLIVFLLAALVAGCAAPITYYSRRPDALKSGAIHFVVEGGVYSVIALYEDAKTCKGIQRVAFFEPDVDKTVYVPHGDYLTFSDYVQFPGGTSFKSGSSMYSVPFRSGNLRVSVLYNATNLFTKIERQEANGEWVLVKNAIKRKSHQPFLESGDWCKPSVYINGGESASLSN